MSDWEEIPKENNGWEPIPSKIKPVESLVRGAAQTASLGFADEVTAGGEALWNKFNTGGDLSDLYEKSLGESRRNYDLAREANPIASGVGTVAGAFVPGLGIAKGLKSLGTGAQLLMKARPIATQATVGALEGAAAGYGTSTEKDALGQLKDSAIGGLTGGVVGGLFAKAAQKIGRYKSAAESIDSPSGPIGGGDDIARIQNEALGNPELRPDAENIKSAWGRMGAQAPQYALTKDKPVQNLASEIIQSPTLAGRAERKAISPIYKGLEGFADDVVSQSGGASRAQTGAIVRAQLSDKFERATEPAKQIYESLESEFKGVPVRKMAINRALNRLNKTVGKFDDSANSLIEQLRSYASKVEDVSDLKDLRTTLNKSFLWPNLTDNQKSVVSDFYGVLTRERNRSILNNFFSQGPKELVDATRQDAQRVLSELQKADSMWRGAMEKFGGLAPSTRRGASQYSSIKEYLSDSTPLEQYVSDLFDAGDLQSLNNLKKQFPDVFDTLRKRALGETIDRATNRVTGELNTRNLVGQIGGIKDETTRNMILGDLAPKFNDARTIYGSLPEKFNPSESATSLKYYGQMLDPRRWRVEAEAGVQRGLIRGEPVTSGAAQKVLNLSNAPRAIIQKLKSVATPSPYASVLESALQRGDASYASTYFLLQQTDPEFRKAVEDNGTE